MTHQGPWGFGSVRFIICIIVAGVVVNLLFKTPNNTGGGVAMMFLIMVVAVIVKVGWQFLLDRFGNRRGKN